MFRSLAILLLAVGSSLAHPAAVKAQQTETMPSPVKATPATERAQAVARREAMRASSLVGQVAFRSVGPTVMSGRVVDIDAWTKDPTHFFVAYASGGLWRTVNNGVSFEPVFDNQGVMTIGDIAVDWAGYPDREPTVWVGTGENNSSRSSYAGDGVYRSGDGGATWEHLGLEATQRTGRIVIHSSDPNTVLVAALGPLYHASPDRGVYRTTDGGRTWAKTLFVDANTGAIDLVAHPTDPNTLYAATWHRERRAWNFVEGGEGSGIYKSTDGGVNWTRLTTEGSGFPTGSGVGRIGLALYGPDPNVLYALLDNYFRQPAEEETGTGGLTRDALRTMTSAAFLALPDSTVEGYLREEGFPRDHTGKSVKAMVKAGTIQPVALVEYVEDANSLLFNSDVYGAEVYRSNDGGRTWAKTHEMSLDGVYSSYGYYFGEIRVAPETPDRLYITGVPLLKSVDGGATWESIGGAGVHSDHQALWLNPSRIGHIINGNDGGLNVTWDDGDTWLKLNTPAVGQFYSVQVDNAEPYNVYGGLQDNGVWYGPSTYQASNGWYGNGQYPYERLAGGDGMQVEVDTRDNNLVYTGSQFGVYARINKESGDRLGIRPSHELGERPLRFNWQVPIHLSRHNQDILYYGSNRLHRSLQQGADMKAISGDLTRGGLKGDVPYGTLTTIDESPLRFGLLYTGSDDGYVHVSRDGGTTWTRISDRLPQNLWVSRVEASAHSEGRVYVTLNGYRSDHFDAYVYASEDYGATWKRIDAGLPDEPVNVIVEDPEVADILYVGTDHGAYVSLDRGGSWQVFVEGLPGAPVHDIKVQAREKDLVLGTHGRSIYIGDLEQVREIPGLMATAVHVFDVEEVRFSGSWGERMRPWSPSVMEPSVTIPFWTGQAGAAAFRVRAKGGEVVYEGAWEASAGLNYHTYDLSVTSTAGLDPAPEAASNGTAYLPAGTYKLEIAAGGETATGELKVTEPRGRGRFGGEPEPRPGIK